MRNLKLRVEYDGTNYFGWQRQKGQISIQQVLEERLSGLLGEKIIIMGSGRTDTGVHAINQYFTFKTDRDLPWQAYVYGLNNLLPSDIRIKAAEEVPMDFNACFSARKKTYLYKVLNRLAPTALDFYRCWHLPLKLNADDMNRAAEIITGTHDFSSFRAALCSRKNPVRTVYEAYWQKEGDFIVFYITANGFLHNMVRILVGNMVEIGSGRISLGQFSGIIKACDRRKAGKTAPPQGLYLYDVYY